MIASTSARLYFMNKSAAKPTLISTGIISGLLLILYFPVLIWSPPWNHNGYYKIIHSNKFLHFNDGILIDLEIDKGNLIISAGTIHHDMGSFWFGNARGTMYSYIQFKDREMQYALHMGNSHLQSMPSDHHTLRKCLNPFTIWYIK